MPAFSARAWQCLIFAQAVIAACLPAAFNPQIAAALRYLRADILAGQWWRIVTASFVHLDTTHLLMNLAGFVLLVWIFAPTLSATRQALALLAGVLATGVGLLCFEPQVRDYVGLSGALHGLFAAGVIVWTAAGNRQERRRGVVLIVGGLTKLTLENTGHAFWLGTSTMPVITAAHLWGAAGGSVWALYLLLAARAHARPEGDAGKQDQ